MLNGCMKEEFQGDTYFPAISHSEEVKIQRGTETRCSQSSPFSELPEENSEQRRRMLAMC